jgi:hypothetical protein
VSHRLLEAQCLSVSGGLKAPVLSTFSLFSMPVRSQSNVIRSPGISILSRCHHLTESRYGIHCNVSNVPSVSQDRCRGSHGRVSVGVTMSIAGSILIGYEKSGAKKYPRLTVVLFCLLSNMGSDKSRYT